MISEQIRCAICHADIKTSSPIFQSKINYGVICSRCINLFDPEEIEIIVKLFILYGGFFGQYKQKRFSIIEKLLEIVETEGNNFNIETTNMKLLHLALIHGITPREFNSLLKSFLRE